MSVAISNPDSRVSVKLSNGATLHLPSHQAAEAGPRVMDTVKILPSVTTTSSFGNFIDLVINPGDIDILSDAWLVLNVGQLTATGTDPTGVCFANDARFWLQHYDVLMEPPPRRITRIATTFAPCFSRPLRSRLACSRVWAMPPSRLAAP